MEVFTLRKKNKLLLCLLLLFSSIFIQPAIHQPVSAIELTDVDYGLFCIWNDVDKPEFLQRVAEGKFDVLLPKIGSWNADNTLNLVQASEINDFISKVKKVNPNVKVIAWFSSIPDVMPDLSTLELRQKCVDEVVRLVNYADWDGILDDTEVYIGTETNQFHYFTSCASVIEGLGVVYYPWMGYKNLPYVNSQRAAVGAYDDHSFFEEEWKSALDVSQETADVAFSWYLIVDRYSDKPTLSQQLEFLGEKIAKRGFAYYSKMDIFGLYYYKSIAEDDWDVWTSWIAQDLNPAPLSPEFVFPLESVIAGIAAIAIFLLLRKK